MTLTIGPRAVYACRMCRKIIGNSPLKRCSSCGYSHSHGEATAIR